MYSRESKAMEGTSHNFVLISFGSVEKFILKKSVVMSTVVDPIPHPITGDPETCVIKCY